MPRSYDLYYLVHTLLWCCIVRYALPDSSQQDRIGREVERRGIVSGIEPLQSLCWLKEFNETTKMV